MWSFMEIMIVDLESIVFMSPLSGRELVVTYQCEPCSGAVV